MRCVSELRSCTPSGKPAFDIEEVAVAGETFPVTESIVLHRPFGNLLRFSHHPEASLEKPWPNKNIPSSGSFTPVCP